jgi:hypothetical protein
VFEIQSKIQMLNEALEETKQRIAEESMCKSTY